MQLAGCQNRKKEGELPLIWQHTHEICSLQFNHACPLFYHAISIILQHLFRRHFPSLYHSITTLGVSRQCPSSPSYPFPTYLWEGREKSELCPPIPTTPGGGGSDARPQSLSHYARMCESAFFDCSSNTANSQKIVDTSVDFSSYLGLNMKFKVFTLSSPKLFAKAPTGCDLWHLGWKNPSSSSVVSPLAAPVINFPPITTYYAKAAKTVFSNASWI